MRIALLALCVAAVQVQAQQAGATAGNPLQEGSWLVAGSARIARVTSKTGAFESKTTAISVNPIAMKFIQNRIAVGGELGLGYSKTGGTKVTTWLLGPAFRYFFFEPPEQNLPFVGAAVMLGSTSFDSGPTSSSTSTLGFEAVGGVTRMVSRNVGLTGEAYLSRTTANPDGTAASTTTTDFGLRAGISAFVY